MKITFYTSKYPNTTIKFYTGHGLGPTEVTPFSARRHCERLNVANKTASYPSPFARYNPVREREEGKRKQGRLRKMQAARIGSDFSNSKKNLIEGVVRVVPQEFKVSVERDVF